MAQSSLPQNVAVIIRISEGTFTDGFSVELHILEDGLLIDKDANLPRIAAAPEISQCYKEWKLTYHALGRALGGRMLRKVHVQATHQSSVETCRRKTQEFETKVKNWLSSSTFSLLRDRIQANVRMAANQSVPIILDCATGILEQDILLRKLPWHTWDLFDRLNYAEVVLSTCFTRPTLSLRSPVKTLAIFGSDEGGLKLEEDITALKELERSGPEILPRVQPDREKLSEWLYGESWDILFFAGHSFSDADCQTGSIQINKGRLLTLDELREDLKRAIHNGLKLIIFNSCDGLGIARFIEQLSVSAGLRMPVLIVMREPVPDYVARKFLRYFLEEFAQGKPLYLAVREARNQLHWMQSDDEQPYPAATWLPIVCQNPNQAELIFPQPEPSPPPNRWLLQCIVGLIVLGSILVIGLLYFSNWVKRFDSSTVNDLPKLSLSSPIIKERLAEVPVPNGTFRYGGSTTWAPIRGSVDLAIQQTLLNFRLHYVDPPTGYSPSTAMGIVLLLKGEIDFAHASRLLNIEDLENAQKQGIRLKAIAIARSFKAIAVHPSLTLKDNSLTLNQIKGICNGRITNWKEVGGPNMPIRVFSRKTPDLVRTLGDNCKGKNVVQYVIPQEALQQLARTYGGVYVNTAPLVVPQCSIKVLSVKNQFGKVVAPYKGLLISASECQAQPNQVNIEAFKDGEYPKELSDTLYVVVKEDGQIGQQSGEAYANLLLSDEGQKLLEAAGFVGVRQMTK